MEKQFNCKIKNVSQPGAVKVRIIKAPLVDSQQLKEVLFARAKAVII